MFTVVQYVITRTHRHTDMLLPSPLTPTHLFTFPMSTSTIFSFLLHPSFPFSLSPLRLPLPHFSFTTSWSPSPFFSSPSFIFLPFLSLPLTSLPHLSLALVISLSLSLSQSPPPHPPLPSPPSLSPSPSYLSLISSLTPTHPPFLKTQIPLTSAT